MHLLRSAVDGTWERIPAALLAAAKAEDIIDRTVPVDSPSGPGRPRTRPLAALADRARIPHAPTPERART
ncbi:hypothetical protein [Streptomyces sp. NBC_00385]|uniref:hypothetical protein n=1 Tax=Streptomyces sp. NBC_00385 TaxID=2975733 RepID=UPI002DDA5261|nr:hypothetical protein [Streptomyces sp. NBC_00385]WRZ08820.1 hypothetical protein OG959_38500 [Streptomyces sp. NBC_00385]